MIISDTNILGSFAAADALLSLQALLGEPIVIPPAVDRELQAGLSYGANHLQRVFAAIETGQIKVMYLNESTQTWLQTLPAPLHDGEREGIALAYYYHSRLLTNDRRALRYCDAVGILTLDLKNLLRQLWLRQVLTQAEVKNLMQRITQVDKTIFTAQDSQHIFAPRRK